MWGAARDKPAARVTQSDVVALNDAVIAAADKRYDEALRGLAGLLERFERAGDREHAAETMFWLAYCYEKTGRKRQAVVFYDQLIRRYPDTRPADAAAERRSQIHFKKPPP